MSDFIDNTITDKKVTVSKNITDSINLINKDFSSRYLLFIQDLERKVNELLDTHRIEIEIETKSIRKRKINKLS